jgi:hypothetical protein
MPDSQYPTASTAPPVESAADRRDPQSAADQPMGSTQPVAATPPVGPTRSASPPPAASSAPEWTRPAADWSAPSHVSSNGAPTGAFARTGLGVAGAPAFAPAPGAATPGGRPGAAAVSGGPMGTSTAAARPVSHGVRARGPRRARLQLRHVDPWTVLKFSCVLSIALFFVWLITIGVLYGVLQVTGVIGKINDTVTTINGTGSTAPISPGIVFGGAAIIGVVNIILFIALSTVGSVVYNLCADLVGGIEVTLSEREA